MQYGSCYVLNGLKLCIPRWKGAKAPLKVQGASRIHLVDNKDLRITELSPKSLFVYKFSSCDIFLATLASRRVAKVSRWRCSWEERSSKGKRGDAMLQSSSPQPYWGEVVFAPCVRHSLPHPHVDTDVRPLLSLHSYSTLCHAPIKTTSRLLSFM